VGDIADIALAFIKKQEEALGIEAEEAKEDIRSDIPDTVESQAGRTSMAAPMVFSHPTLSRTSLISSATLMTGP
jgi:hypothetical protein